jgi:hypothetical protein
MRWRTYERKCEVWAQVVEKADMESNIRAARILAAGNECMGRSGASSRPQTNTESRIGNVQDRIGHGRRIEAVAPIEPTKSGQRSDALRRDRDSKAHPSARP